MEPAEERFWSNVKRCRHGRTCKRCCWEWQGHRGRQGYGTTSWHGQAIGAYRLALILTAGTPVLGGQFVALHRCNNPPCCNPSHLHWGSYSDNRFDHCRVAHWQAVVRSVRSPLRHYTALGVFLRSERARRLQSGAAFAQEVGLAPVDLKNFEQGEYAWANMETRYARLVQGLAQGDEQIPPLAPHVQGARVQPYDVRPEIDAILQTVLDEKQWAFVVAFPRHAPVFWCLTM